MDAKSVAFCQPVAALRELSDAEFLQSLSWQDGAKKSLASAAAAGDVERFFRKLQKRGFGVTATVGRTTHTDPAVLYTDEKTEFPVAAERTAKLVKLLGQVVSAKKKKLAARKSNDISPRHAGELTRVLDEIQADVRLTFVEIQLLLELLLRAGRHLPLELFGRLWRSALTESLELSAELDEAAGSQFSDAERLLCQGELPWEAGLLFSDIENADVLREFGRQHLAEELEDKTDTDGTPQADLLEEFELWLAPLVRAILWGDGFDNPLWGKNEAERFRSLVGIVVPLCSYSGRLPFKNGQARRGANLLETAARTAGWKSSSTERRYLNGVLGRGRPTNGRTGASRSTGRKSDRPVVQSDWARLACLRSGWESDADMLVLAHHGDVPSIELTIGGQSVLSGRWGIELTVDGREVRTVDQWTCTCWYSDKDADYVEIQLSFEDGIRIERQLLLSRTDRYAVLADVISGAGNGRIEYASTLPVLEELNIDADVPTRECRIGRKGLRVRAFPLALPDDRILSAAGSFGRENGRLQLKQSAIGGLYAPVILDWQKKRRRQDADWRTVTVSEAGEIQKSAAASGHRLRIGHHHQLLLYRSLQPPRVPRAVLGQHTSNETLLGHFDSAGDVTPILIVE